MSRTSQASGKINTPNNEIWLDTRGILHVRATEQGEIDLDEVKACFAVYEKLGCREKKVLQLVDARVGLTMSKEARDFVAKEGVNYFIASAVVSDSLSVRLVINFFNFFYKHKVPLRLFRNEEEALKWLRKFRR
jgi:hypothetical protein